MSEFVEVVVKATKRKQTIPAHWLEHPSLSEPFTLTPSLRQREERTPEPSENWTVAQLRDHAEQAGVDLTGTTTKADILSALNDAPATGEEED